MPSIAASSRIDRLFERSGPRTATDSGLPLAPAKCQRASPCTVL